jgi:hypothetical protein
LYKGRLCMQGIWNTDVGRVKQVSCRLLYDWRLAISQWCCRMYCCCLTTAWMVSCSAVCPCVLMWAALLLIPIMCTYPSSLHSWLLHSRGCYRSDLSCLGGGALDLWCIFFSSLPLIRECKYAAACIAQLKSCCMYVCVCLCMVWWGWCSISISSNIISSLSLWEKRGNKKN